MRCFMFILRVYLQFLWLGFIWGELQLFVQ